MAMNKIQILLLLLFNFLKPVAQAQEGKTKLFTNCKRKNNKHLRHGKQGSNQWLTAPLNPFNVPVSNTVQGKPFRIQTWAGRKRFSSWGVLTGATVARECRQAEKDFQIGLFYTAATAARECRLAEKDFQIGVFYTAATAARECRTLQNKREARWTMIRV